MPRYIDADLLSTNIQKYQCISCSAEYSKDNIRCSACEIAECLRMIDNAPTADVQEVKHGWWIHVAGMNSKCSCCGNYFPAKEFEQRPFDVNYCIWCGARMDLKDGEEDATN